MVTIKNSAVKTKRFSTAVCQRGVDQRRIYCSNPTKSNFGTSLEDEKEIAVVQAIKR